MVVTTLAQLYSIRNRLIALIHYSPDRMGIPKSLHDADLETNGYHRGCYQNFTNHLDCLMGVGSTTHILLGLNITLTSQSIILYDSAFPSRLYLLLNKMKLKYLERLYDASCSQYSRTRRNIEGIYMETN